MAAGPLLVHRSRPNCAHGQTLKCRRKMSPVCRDGVNGQGTWTDFLFCERKQKKGEGRQAGGMRVDGTYALCCVGSYGTRRIALATGPTVSPRRGKCKKKMCALYLGSALNQCPYPPTCLCACYVTFVFTYAASSMRRRGKAVGNRDGPSSVHAGWRWHDDMALVLSFFPSFFFLFPFFRRCRPYLLGANPRDKAITYR